MRSKIIYIVAVVVQIVILGLFIFSETSVLKSDERFVSATKMVELQRFTDSQQIHLSYPINELSSMNCEYEAGGYAKNHPVYVKIRKTDAGIKPAFFSVSEPEVNADEILLKGKVDAVSSEKLYILKYEAKGKQFESRWMGRIRRVKKGDPVMLSLNPLDPAQIEYVSKWKEYQTRTPGKITRINQAVMNGQRIYQLTIEFERNGRKVTEQYTQFVADLEQPVVLGAQVEVNFNEATNKILYVNYNPLVKAVISNIKTGYNLQVSYGLETYNMQAAQKDELNELIDRYGDAQVSAEFVVSECGNSALTGIFISGQKVALN